MKKTWTVLAVLLLVIQSVVRASQPPEKGQSYFQLSVPFINSFYLQPEFEERKVLTKFLGFLIGFDFHHSNKQFINVNGGLSTATDFIPIIQVLNEQLGENESMHTWYLSVSNNHLLGRVSTGYGLSYGKNQWRGRTGLEDSVTKIHNAFGLVFPTYLRVTDHLYLGVIYRPTFFRPNVEEKFVYEHLISIDIALKLKVK